VQQEHAGGRILSFLDPSRAQQPVSRQLFHASKDAQRRLDDPAKRS
jgi:hypothetical protein